MKMRNLTKRILIAGGLPLMVMASVLCAASLTVGSAFPKMEGMDQHEKAIGIGPGTQHVVITFTMGMGKKANKYFAEKGASFLEENDLILINDIHGMPAVGRVFALPKMRKYPHRIFLADADGLLEPFPSKEGMATVFDLDDNMNIVAIRFWDPADGSDPF
jgi:hypothetical protein